MYALGLIDFTKGFIFNILILGAIDFAHAVSAISLFKMKGLKFIRRWLQNFAKSTNWITWYICGTLFRTSCYFFIVTHSFKFKI